MSYVISRSPEGRYVVIAAPAGLTPLAETWNTREEAQSDADWMNSLMEEEVAA